METKLLKVFLLIFLFVIGCQGTSQRDKNQIAVFNLEVLPNTSSIKLSDLGFDHIEYVPLETTDQSLMGGRFDLSDPGSRLLIGSDYYIVKQFNTVLKFRNDGSFVARIGTIGRGPNEILNCNDVAIDKENNIYIVDAFEKKIFIYSGNGEFIKTVNYPIYGAREFRFVEGMFLSYSQNNLGNVEDSFNLIDSTGNIVKKFPNIYPFVKQPNEAYGFVHEVLFYNYDNKLFKKEVYSDTIFSFENFEFEPHMVINLGDKSITQKARSEISGMDISKKFIIPRNLFEFGDFIYYEFGYGFVNYSFIGSKKSSFQALIKTGEGIINDLDGGPNILPMISKDDKSIIGWIESIQLKAYVTSSEFLNSKPKYPEKKKALEELANKLTIYDNPVLMVVTFNK